MTLTTKIVRQYQSCGQVMPVPVVIKKLACWRPPAPLHPPPQLQPSYPYQPYAPQQNPQLYPQQNYRPYQQPYPYPNPVYAIQQIAPQQQQQPPQNNQIYAITAPNEPIPPLSFQTQLIPSEDDSDRYYRLPPNYPIIEYTSDISVPTGNIVIQTTNTVPDGYLLCDGSEISREAEATLFSVIGTFYGNGDGSETFCLPDLEDEDSVTHHYMIKQ